MESIKAISNTLIDVAEPALNMSSPLLPAVSTEEHSLWPQQMSANQVKWASPTCAEGYVHSTRMPRRYWDNAELDPAALRSVATGVAGQLRGCEITAKV